jgi:hypothetical protein
MISTQSELNKIFQSVFVLLLWKPCLSNKRSLECTQNIPFFLKLPRKPSDILAGGRCVEHEMCVPYFSTKFHRKQIHFPSIFSKICEETNVGLLNSSLNASDPDEIKIFL